MMARSSSNMWNWARRRLGFIWENIRGQGLCNRVVTMQYLQSLPETLCWQQAVTTWGEIPRNLWWHQCHHPSNLPTTAAHLTDCGNLRRVHSGLDPRGLHGLPDTPPSGTIPCSHRQLQLSCREPAVEKWHHHQTPLSREWRDHLIFAKSSNEAQRMQSSITNLSCFQGDQCCPIFQIFSHEFINLLPSPCPQPGIGLFSLKEPRSVGNNGAGGCTCFGCILDCWWYTVGPTRISGYLGVWNELGFFRRKGSANWNWRMAIKLSICFFQHAAEAPELLTPVDRTSTCIHGPAMAQTCWGNSSLRISTDHKVQLKDSRTGTSTARTR